MAREAEKLELVVLSVGGMAARDGMVSIHKVKAEYICGREYQYGFSFMFGYRRIRVSVEWFRERPYITFMLPWWNIVLAP